MKAVIVFAALLAVVLAQNITSTGNSTSTSGNRTSTSGNLTSTGNFTTTGVNTTSTGRVTTSSNSTSSSSSASTSSSSTTTAVSSTTGTTGVSSASATSSTASPASTTGTTGAGVTYTVQTTLYTEINGSVCLGPNPLTAFDATSYGCVLYPLALHGGFNISARPVFDGETSVDLTLYMTVGGAPVCQGTPILQATFVNGECSLIALQGLPPMPVRNSWGSATTGPAATTGDTGAAAFVAPSFLAAFVAAVSFLFF